LSYGLYTPALPPAHTIVGLPQMEGVAHGQFVMQLLVALNLWFINEHNLKYKWIIGVIIKCD